jgi:hypothetical protein
MLQRGVGQRGKGDALAGNELELGFPFKLFSAACAGQHRNDSAAGEPAERNAAGK